MALNNMGLGFLFTAKNLASGQVRGLRNDFSGLRTNVDATRASFTRNVAAMGAGIAGLAAGGLILGAQFKLAKAAGEFEQGLAAVGAVTRATTEELKMLSDTAIQAGIATQFSPKEAVEGLTSLATAGQSAQAATETLIPVLDLAAGSLGQLGVAGAAEAVVGTLNAYGMAAGEATDITDKLLRVTQLTNFQAKDFSTGLAKAAAAGGVFGQSLDDTLLVMGQLRNMNIEASSASTAYREATRRLAADQRAQSAVTGAGVDIYDQQTGKIRSLVDVMQDLNVSLADSTEKERNATVARAFGARGLLAFAAIQKAAATKILPDGTKQVLKGAEAIKFLRQELGNAEGTAKEFKDRLLDTFQGQMTLVRGSVQTFITVVGVDMAKAIRPAIESIIGTLNRLIKRWQALSQETKDKIAHYIKMAGVILTIGGAALFLSGAIPMLLRGLGALRAAAAVAAGSLMRMAIPIAAVVGAAALIKKAYDKNLGGFGDFVDKQVSQAKLAWNGLVQLFTQGGFSGAVRDEFAKAENQGVKQFVIRIGMLVERAKVMFEGFVDGFRRAWGKIAPALEGVGLAFGGVLESFEELIAAIFGSRDILGDSSDAWRDFGEDVGFFIGEAFAIVIGIVEIALETVETFVDGAKVAFDTLGNPLDLVEAGFKKIEISIDDVTTSSDDLQISLNALGKALGFVGGFIAEAIAVSFYVISGSISDVIWLVDALAGVLVSFGESIGEGLGWWVIFFSEDLPKAFKKTGDLFEKYVTDPIVDAMEEAVRVFKAAVKMVKEEVAKVIMKLPAMFLPDDLVDWAKSNRAIESTPQYWHERMLFEGRKYAPEGSAEALRVDRTVIVPNLYSDEAWAAYEEKSGMQPPIEVKQEIVLKVGEEELARVNASIDRDGAVRNLEQVPVGAQ